MKRILIVANFIFTGHFTQGQSVTTSPAVFTAEDEVTLTIDVSGSGLDGYTGDVWLWTWIAEGCTANCDAPTNINPAGNSDTDGAKLTRDSSNPNVYTFIMTPTSFYNKTPAEIKQIGLLVKGRDWSDGQTSNMLLSVQPLEFVPNQSRSFPAKFTSDDILTFFFDQSLATNEAMKDLTEVFVHVFYSVKKMDGSVVENIAYTDWGNVGNTPELKTTSRGSGIYSLSIIPNSFLNLAEGDQILKIGYLFRSQSGDASTPDAQAIPNVTE